MNYTITSIANLWHAALVRLNRSWDAPSADALDTAGIHMALGQQHAPLVGTLHSRLYVSQRERQRQAAARH